MTNWPSVKATLTIWPSTRVFTATVSYAWTVPMPRTSTGMSLVTATSVTTGTGGTCVDAAARALSRPISETTNQPTTIRPATTPAMPTLDNVRLFIRGKLHRRIALEVHPLLWRLHGYTRLSAGRARGLSN